MSFRVGRKNHTKWYFRGATLPSEPEVWRVFWPLRCFQSESAFTTQRESSWTRKGVTL